MKAHDAHGKEVTVGDSVNVPCVVKEIFDRDKVILETKFKEPGASGPSDLVLHSEQVIYEGEGAPPPPTGGPGTGGH